MSPWSKARRRRPETGDFPAVLAAPAFCPRLCPAAGAPLDPISGARIGVALHVSKSGDNSDGTTWVRAFHTIQSALDAIPDEKGGHRILIRPDTYPEANLYPARKGAPGAHNALQVGYPGFEGYTRISFRNCRLVVMNFSQPHGTPATGIIYSDLAGRFLHLDLEDNFFVGYKVFGALSNAVFSYSVTGTNRAYVQYRQEVPEGIQRERFWPSVLCHGRPGHMGGGAGGAIRGTDSGVLRGSLSGGPAEGPRDDEEVMRAGRVASATERHPPRRWLASQRFKRRARARTAQRSLATPSSTTQTSLCRAVVGQMCQGTA